MSDYNYHYNYIVSKNEVNDLKELIFKRAQERADAMAKDAQNSYMDSFKNDLMDIARNSLTDKKNPFYIEKTTTETTNIAKSETKPETKSEITQSVDNVGFKNSNVADIKQHIENKDRLVKESFSKNEISQNMRSARHDIENKRTFTGALEFLNSQASIVLIKSKSPTFNALA